MIDNLSAGCKKSISVLILSLSFVLTSCGGGGGGSDPAPGSTSQNITGGGVKGPLANAVVTVYAFDGAQPDNGFQGAVVDTAATDANAAITGLALPFPVTPPYIMEFTSDAGTTDITTGQFPVITTLRTVITQSLLDGGEQIYATPLTTMAVDIAVRNAVDTNDTTGIQADEFEAALTVAASQVVSTLGFGMDGSVDIFDTPPLIDSTTVSTEEQTNVAAYRAAVEAVTAIAYQIDQQTAGGDTGTVLAELAADLADGGGIDGSAGSEINDNTLQVLEQDPASLVIPNTVTIDDPDGQTVGEVQDILVAETTETATSTDTTVLVDGSITTTTAPAETDPDIDNDGHLNADDAFPTDVNEYLDTDGDGTGNNADTDDDNDGWADGANVDDYPLDATRFIDPLLDRDVDGTDNGVDNCPLISNDQTDTDGDGIGDECDPVNDQDADGIDDDTDNCPAVANTPQTDTGGSTAGDACDTDIDGDGIANDADAFPYDSNETIDTDGDGVGDNADTDADNDGLSDDEELAPGADGFTTNPLLRDTDGDGVFDGADFDPTNSLVTFNFAPVVTNDTATADEDAATFSIAVTANDTDDGVPAAMTLTDIGANDTNLGIAVINGNNIDYTPVANASGVDTFTYTVFDGAVSSVASVTVTITAVNDAPVITQASPVAVVMDEDGVPTDFVAAVIDASDEEGDTLTWSLSSAATSGMAAVSGTGASPTVTYAPNANYFGDDSFDATVSDGNGGSAVITIDVKVNTQNDVPVVAAAGPYSVAEDAVNTTIVGTVIASDVEGPVTGYNITSGNIGTAFTINASGEISVANSTAIDYESLTSYSLTITATDGVATSAGEVVVVDIIDVNDTAPVVSVGQIFNIVEDAANATVVGSVLATDADSAVTDYSITAGDASGAFAISTAGQITVADSTAIDFETNISFNLTVVATDGVNDSAGVSVTVDVNDVNDTAPVVSVGQIFNIVEDAANTTVVGSVQATDVDSAVADYSITAGDASGAFAISTAGEITVANTTAIDYESATSFNLTITATDGVTPSAGELVVVDVTDVNDTAPVVAASQSFNVINTATNGAVVGTVSATDADTVGGITNFSITGTVFAISASGQITVIDEANLVSGGPTYNLTVDATDGTNLSASENVTITVVSNAPPVIDQTGPIEVIMDEDEFPQDFVAPFISATDADSLDWSLGSVVTNGTATVSGTGVASTALISYTPDPDFNGIDSFVVEVTDGTSTDSITINVTVNSINDVPVARDDNDTTAEDTAFTTLNVLDSDNDGGDGPVAISVAFADGGSFNGGSVIDNGDGTFGYTPPADFNGFDSFSYTVTDGADSVSATVTIDVTPVNDAPVAVNDSESTTVDTFITTANVLTNDTDVDNAANELSISAADTTSENLGTVANLGDGTFTYTPASGFTGTDRFTYTVFDGVDTDIGTVTITVSPPGTSIAMSDLMGPANGGVGGLDSFDNGSGLTQFEIWTDTYDSGTGDFNFIDAEFNYATGVFDVLPEDVADGFVLNGGSWVQATAVTVTAFGTGAGGQSMDVSVVSGVTEIESVRISAQFLDISGDRLDSHLNFDWRAQMIDPNLVFAIDSKLITQYQFEHLIDAYFLYEDDWCATNDPERFSVLGGNCNGINSTVDASGYATTLDQVIVVSEWTDPDDGSTPPDALFVAYNDANNTQLQVQLVAGGAANYYVIDWSNPDVVAAPVAGTWVRDTNIQLVDMIRYEIPASLQPLFADDLDEGLNNLLAIQGGFVRQGDFNFAGDSSFDNASPLLNGIAKDQVLANFDAPTLPDVTELLGTWVNQNASFNGDQSLLHFFAEGNYESSGTCSDGSEGMEYGTYTWDNLTGAITATSQGNATQGSCSPEQGALNGDTISINGDVLTLNSVNFGTITYDRLKGSSNPLVGSWVLGDITSAGEGGLGGHALLTFLDDGLYMHSEDCTSAGLAGIEFGNYLWGQGGTELLTGDVLVDANGDCGPALNINSPTTTVVGDTLTLDFGGSDVAVATRHSPAFAPIVAAIPFAGLAGTEHYNVFYDDEFSNSWVVEKMTFDIDGVTYTHTNPDGAGDPVGSVENGSYEIISGVLHFQIGLDGDNYIMIMSVDAVTGANRTCWAEGSVYANLANCTPPGDNFMFNDLTEAVNFKDDMNAPAVFSGSAVAASTVFANGGIFNFEFGWDSLEYWALQWDGATVTDDSYDFDPMAGNFVLNTQTTDIALTSTGWQIADWRFDTQTEMATTATFQNLEGGVPLNEVDVTFNQMDITGLPLFDFVESPVQQFMDNGVYSAGATAYEITFTENITYRNISLWDDFCDGQYNGNCNVVRSQQLDLVSAVGELSASAVETDTSFIGIDATAIEIGYSNNGSGQQLFAVFNADNSIEFWEVDWNVDSIAVLSGFTGSWTTNVVNTATLLEYTIPAGLLGGIYSFQFNSDDGQTGGFMSVENGYLRNGQIDSTAGDTGTFIVLDPIAAQDVVNSIE